MKCILHSGWFCLTSRPILGRCGSLTVYACVHAGVKGENEALSSWLSTCSVENWTDTFEAQRCNWLQLNLVVLIPQVPDSPTISDLSGGSLPVVLTTDVQRGLDMFSPWLQGSNKHPFIVVGPEGCGKEWVLTYNHHFHEQWKLGMWEAGNKTFVIVVSVTFVPRHHWKLKKDLLWSRLQYFLNLSENIYSTIINRTMQ